MRRTVAAVQPRKPTNDVEAMVHFMPVKSKETQGAVMVLRVRELLIRQRAQAINTLRGHLTEFGQVVPQDAANVSKLIALVEVPKNSLSADAIPTLNWSRCSLI